MIGDDSHRMIIWEGAILLFAVFLGGLALVILSYRDYQRHERLRTFFATFSHDLKTSLSVLRLKTELLLENAESRVAADPEVVGTLAADVSRIDLQLENSLWLSRGETRLNKESLLISNVVEQLRPEFPTLNISIDNDQKVLTDARGLLSVFRNLFSNSILHGHASEVRIACERLSAQTMKLDYSDNGRGMTDRTSNLKGHDLLALPKNQPQRGSRSNGIGLHLVQKILMCMDGKFTLREQAGPGFHATILLPARNLEAKR